MINIIIRVPKSQHGGAYRDGNKPILTKMASFRKALLETGVSKRDLLYLLKAHKGIRVDDETPGQKVIQLDTDYFSALLNATVKSARKQGLQLSNPQYQAAVLDAYSNAKPMLINAAEAGRHSPFTRAREWLARMTGITQISPVQKKELLKVAYEISAATADAAEAQEKK